MLGKDYFLKVYNEEVEQVEEGTPNDVKVDEPVVEPVVTPSVEDSKDTPPVVDDKTPVVEPTPTEKPTVFNIDGEDVSLDVIKEWKQGNMRQSDYTRKTQELAKQKRELEELKLKNGEVDDTEPLEKSPELKRIEKIEFELANKQLDLDISILKQKYPDFDEVKVLNECDKRGIYDDIEFVYKALRDTQTKPSEPLDIEKVKQQAIDEYKNTIAKELAKDKEATSGSIISSSAGQAPTDYSDLLSDDEKEYANRRGYTYEEYAKLKDAQYKI